MFRLKIGDNLETPEGKKFYNEQVFTEIAPRYDAITRILSFGRDSAWKRDLVGRLPTLEAPFCLDLACGTGDIAFLLAEKYSRGTIVAVDITEPMLDLARKRNRFSFLRFSRQDMSRLDCETGSVDIVTGGYALRNAPDLEVALKEISRILKPGGIGAFLDFSNPPHPALAWVQHVVLTCWTGFWGLCLHGNHEVYSYIAASLHRFPDRLTLRRRMEECGMPVIRSRSFFLGIVELLVVQKNR